MNYTKVQRYKIAVFHYFKDPNDFYNICQDRADPMLWFLTEYDPPWIFDPKWYK